MLIAGTLFAWAVSLRLLSDALFAALSAYMALWGAVVLNLLFLLGLYTPQPTPSSLEAYHDEAEQQYLEEYSNQQQQPQQTYHSQSSPFMSHALLTAAPEHHPRRHHHQQQHPQDCDHVHTWVASAALQAAHCSPGGSPCPSITSPPVTQPTSLESSSNGSSSAPSAQTFGRAVTASYVLEALHDSEEHGPCGEKLTPEARLATCMAAWVLANRMSEPGVKPARVTSAGVCPPPLEYEASEELQQELEAAAPDEFMCPIGRVLMVDPVFTPSGFTYHRPCIMAYIQRTGRDPAHDATPLTPQQLCPNVNLRDQIATWLQKQGVAT